MWRILIILNFLTQCALCDNQPIVIPVLSSPVSNIPISPVWDDCTQSVYYVDFLATGQQHSILRYDFNEDKVYGAYIEGYARLTFILPLNECNKSKNLFVIAAGHATTIINWNGRSPVAKVIVKTLFSIEKIDPTSSLSLGRQSEQGRFYGGSFHISHCKGPNNSTFFTYTKENGFKHIISGLQATTGIAFDGSEQKLYVADFCEKKIIECQTDDDTCKNRVVFDFKNAGVAPINLDSDSNGMLYTANYFDGAIWQIDPKSSSGRVVAHLNVKGITGVTFGGPKREIIFAIVGSAMYNFETGQVDTRTNGPSLYKIIGLNATGRKFSRLSI